MEHRICLWLQYHPKNKQFSRFNIETTLACHKLLCTVQRELCFNTLLAVNRAYGFFLNQNICSYLYRILVYKFPRYTGSLDKFTPQRFPDILRVCVVGAVLHTLEDIVYIYILRTSNEINKINTCQKIPQYMVHRMTSVNAFHTHLDSYLVAHI